MRPLATQLSATPPAKTQVPGAGRLTQPACALEQHFLAVVLHLPRHVLPMPHGRAGFPFFDSVRHPGLVELRVPFRHAQFAVLELEQLSKTVGAAVRRKAHHFAAFVPVGEDVARHAAVERAEAVHVEELVAEKSAARLQPYLLQRLELAAFEFVVALRFPGERIDALGELTRLLDVGGIAADAVDDHHHAFVERTDGEGTIGVGEMMRDRHHLVRFRQVERAFGRLLALALGDVALIDHAYFQLFDRQDVAIAHHQIDVIERDAFGIEAIVDDLLKEPAGMLLTRNPLLLDAVGDSPSRSRHALTSWSYALMPRMYVWFLGIGFCYSGAAPIARRRRCR